MDGISFLVLSPVQVSALSHPFSLDEVDRVVVDCDGNKSPGPYEFNFPFIKAFKDMLYP